jgi:hypothetical protein
VDLSGIFNKLRAYTRGAKAAYATTPEAEENRRLKIFLRLKGHMPLVRRGHIPYIDVSEGITVEGHKIESLELLTDDDKGLLLERTIAYRPFPAVKIFRERLIALNAGTLPADMWEYPA